MYMTTRQTKNKKNARCIVAVQSLHKLFYEKKARKDVLSMYTYVKVNRWEWLLLYLVDMLSDYYVNILE